MNNDRVDAKINNVNRETVLSGSFPSYVSCSASEPASAPGRQAAQETAENTVSEQEMTNPLYDLFVVVSEIHAYLSVPTI